jgi:TonB family protein
MRVSLPRPGSLKRLGPALAASLLFHLALLSSLLLVEMADPRIDARKGEPIIIELPRIEEEPAPRGDPARPVVRPAPPPSRPPAPPPAAAPPAPMVETGKPAPVPEPAAPPPAPEPERVARAAPAPEPEAPAPAPVPAEPAPPAAAAPAPAPEPPSPPASEPKVALSKPAIDVPPGLQGGVAALPPGGGLRRGRAGVEGEPVPLDTRDPRYTDYFEKIRRQIRANWVYPREAGERGIGGQLVIEFGIRKDGWLQFVELRRSSGVPVLDQYALNALKLAQPFPPVPDSVARGTLAIAGFFNYVIVDSGLLNQYLR